MPPESDFDFQSDVFRQLYEQARLLYNFSSLMSVHANHKNCSRIAPDMTMTEVHLLIDIMDHPGIRVSELGRLNKKTRGAISQMVKRLENAGMLTKSASARHGKMLDLNLTPLGMEVARNHAASDVRAFTRTLDQLMETCSVQEINHFYKVLQRYNEILQAESKE